MKHPYLTIPVNREERKTNKERGVLNQRLLTKLVVLVNVSIVVMKYHETKSK